MSQPRFVSSSSEEERRQLDGLHRTGRSSRVRQRAHAVLLSAPGYTLDQAADILVLDHGPCHRRKLVKARRAAWRRRGLSLLFLPPSCPHLHRVETF